MELGRDWVIDKYFWVHVRVCGSRWEHSRGQVMLWSQVVNVFFWNTHACLVPAILPTVGC